MAESKPRILPYNIANRCGEGKIFGGVYGCSRPYGFGFGFDFDQRFVGCRAGDL